MTNLVRIWVGVNGNYRAWPLELNRSKSNREVIEENVDEYNLPDIESVCEASFIKEINPWLVLQEKGGDRFWEKGDHWKVFIEASMDRNLNIYKEWYEKMRINELMN